MRLINTSTLQLESFSSSKSTPPYAILSHTWGKDEDEVSFEDMKPKFRSSQTEKKYGFEKIKATCQLARNEYNLKYAWIDTCCIDKSSSAELSESINSMFTWYREAVVCFAFLADWEPEDQTFTCFKWFTRGWTLQELVASKTIIFYDKTWQARGNKPTHCAEIARISSISEDVLTGQTQLAAVPVAVRLSWAAERTTTREEDIAYSLLGIFDINMPMLYGEGSKAFLRLQEEIIKNTADMSIFAWKALPETCQDCMGILAPSPREFKHASRMYPALSHSLVGERVEFSISNRGVEFHAPLQTDKSTGYSILPILHSDLTPDVSISDFFISERTTGYGVYLRWTGSTYVRRRPYSLANFVLQYKAMSNPTSFRAFKKLSAEDSDAVGRREVIIRKPADLEHPNFGLATVKPKSAWIPSIRTLAASHTMYSVASLNFKPIWTNEFPSFTLICKFENPRGTRFSPGFWKCDLVQEGDEWQTKRILDHFSTYDVLACPDDTPSLVTKILDLPHLRGDSRTKRVVLSLQRERNEENGSTQVFIDLEVSDRD
ncbi:uncharacterized protein PAC_06251 [Phialocephala subalpina]|uniref:Uncharacterized protein n=1 Tax=Phialocephala subalpina TaxID=576137 RepID=A0A1L7WUF5_9HELO|nr:uncharacterized protein PAC_06251 [Phialocephala subalpina]